MTDQSAEVLDAARALLAAAWPLVEERGITLVGISLTNLENGDRAQLALPLDTLAPSALRTSLDTALDEVKERYGSTAVMRAVLVGRSPGISMPLLPD